MNKNNNQKEKEFPVWPLFSSSNWIYPIIFFPEERKLIYTSKLFRLKKTIYNLETRIKESLFDFSRLMEEGLWDAIFIYLLGNLNYRLFEVEVKEKKIIFKKIHWEAFKLTKKKYSEVKEKIVTQITTASQIVVDNKNEKKLFDLKEFVLDNFVNILLKKHKITFLYCPRSSKEFNIATLLLSFPWYKDYLGFIWTFFRENFDQTIDAKMVLKLILLDDLNIQENSTFAKVDKFIDGYGGWSGGVDIKDWFKFLEILGFIFNEVKSNSDFGEIIGVFKKLKRDKISFYAQKTRQKLLFSRETFFLKKGLKPEVIKSMIFFAKKMRDFASHTQNTKKFTEQNLKTPIESMLYILENIEFEDNKTFLHFRFVLKAYLDQICNFHEKGVFSVFGIEDYSSKNILRDIKNLFFGEKGSKHFLLNLNQKEQDEYDKEYNQNK